MNNLIKTVSLIFVLISAHSNAATFEVNTTSDVDDGACNAASCSLREAIVDANAAPGQDIIDFSGDVNS